MDVQGSLAEGATPASASAGLAWKPLSGEMEAAICTTHQRLHQRRTSPRSLSSTTSIPSTTTDSPPATPSAPVQQTPVQLRLSLPHFHHVPGTLPPARGARNVLTHERREPPASYAGRRVRARAVADRQPDQDSQEEECQEGNPVLPDGVRRLGHRYVAPAYHAEEVHDR